jgi:hypothetical protein
VGSQRFCVRPVPRYNRSVVIIRCRSRVVLFLLAAGWWVGGCGAALGPGYVIDRQEIQVHFITDSQPAIRVESDYRLRNNGNRPLQSLELRLPGRRRFHFADPRAEWDSRAMALATSPDNARNAVLTFAEPWEIGAVHSLHLSVEFQPSEGGEGGLSFAPDAFFLPAEGWSPQLLPTRGIFAKGGVPPKTWLLRVTVPDGFLVHLSGRQSRPSRSRGEQIIRAAQQPTNGYPFVIAGRFHTTQFKAEPETLTVWTRSSLNAVDLRATADSLIKTFQSYNTMFGSREKESHQLWLVECPVVGGCFAGGLSNFSRLISDKDEKQSAQMASRDTVMVDFSSGTSGIVGAVGPSLASSWLGYGRNPGFYEQDPPLSALPAFAAARGREAVLGPQVRADTIRRALGHIPANADEKKIEDDNVIRAKSLLFFYGLQDRYGRDVFNKALTHMLYARRGGGFDLDDLIAAFEQETHQNVAEFVRLWMKHPGVPSDFRARYGEQAAALSTNSTQTKETLP